MERPYVEELRIQNYGCIQDATFHLSPLHALIGPNDSGKSTVLRALQSLGRWMPRLLEEVRGEPGLNARERGARITASTKNATLEVNFEREPDFLFRMGSRDASSDTWYRRGEGAARGPVVEELRAAIGGATLMRLAPDALRAPHALIADDAPLRFADERGGGLPSLYDALVTRNVPALAEYRAVNEGFQRLFPNVQSILVTNPSGTTKAIGVKLVDGTVVPAELMSEGMLYYLAFAILPYLELTPLLLVEEPENGLHPARIAEVLRVLRSISDKTQVILATHNPLVINELEPNEVTVVTRTKDHGTKATLMKDTPNFDERSKVYALGELWLSYANGEDEAPLLQGGPRP